MVFCDLPQVPPGAVGKFIITQMAAVAELEAGLISQRTKAALAAAKQRGASLGGWRGGPVVEQVKGVEALQRRASGFAEQVQPIIAELSAGGASLREIAAELTRRGIRTSRGGQWTATAVRRVVMRLESPAEYLGVSERLARQAPAALKPRH